MPVLRKRIDGEYIIRGLIPGVGKFSTWQVAPEGVTLLRRMGIHPGDEISWTLLRDLRDQGLVYTFGTGLGLETRADAEVPLVPRPDPLPLILSEDEDGWQLRLMLPALPKSYLAAIGREPLDTLEHCSLRVDLNQVVPGSRLWPGKGGTACEVVPHEHPYWVELIGPWPGEWDLTPWTRGADGLRAAGTLFAGSELGGLRLRAGEPILPGASYYLVALDDPVRPLSGTGILPIPVDLNPRELPSHEGWKAWELRVPNAANERVREWCLRIGHPLGEPAWRLDLISPPPLRYSPIGLPIVEVGREVVIAACPPSPLAAAAEGCEVLVERDGCEVARVPIQPGGLQNPSDPAFRAKKPIEDESGKNRHRESLYLALRVTEDGIYRLRAARGRVTPFAFAAELAEPHGEPPDLSGKPAPLEAIVSTGSSELHLRAFVDGSGPHEIAVASLGGSTAPAITVRCPAPVDLSWWCGQIRGRGQRVQPEQVQVLLAADLTAGLSRGGLFRLCIDAGNFGRLRIHFLPPELATPSTATPPGAAAEISLSPRTARRARWLAQAVPALLEQCDMATAPIRSDIRAALARLDSLQEGLALGRITVAPRPLMPHLKALAYALNQPGYRPARRYDPPVTDAQQVPGASRWSGPGQGDKP